jgi:TIR domain
MPLFTSTSLKERSLQKSFSERQVLLNESSKKHYSFDIFLSHSFLDKEEVEGLYLLLTGMGYTVYVDWIIDPHLDRKNVTKSTAELIRSRMKSSKSLLLAISTNAVMSKWMPWELGFVDGNTNRCAILPVSQSSIQPKTFNRSEYLLLYPYIKKATIDYSEKIYITESSNNYVVLDNWLKRNQNPIYNFKNIDDL